jgi:hypothetical protein
MQDAPWTFDILADHVSSGEGDLPHVSLTILQPFISDTTPDGWTFALNTQSTLDR